MYRRHCTSALRHVFLYEKIAEKHRLQKRSTIEKKLVFFAISESKCKFGCFTATVRQVVPIDVQRQ